jgi:hypothetical protein
MNILYISTIITSILMLSLLALVFFEMEFRKRNAHVNRNAFRSLAAATICAILITGFIGLNTPVAQLSAKVVTKK